MKLSWLGGKLLFYHKALMVACDGPKLYVFDGDHWNEICGEK